MTRLTSEWSRARKLSLGLIMRGERRFNIACAGVSKSYRAAVVDLRLAPKTRGCSLCLAAILVYARVNGRKETGAVPHEVKGYCRK